MTEYVVAFEMAVTVDVSADSEEEAERIARERCVGQNISQRLDHALTGTDFTSSSFYDDVEIDEMGPLGEHVGILARPPLKLMSECPACGQVEDHAAGCPVGLGYDSPEGAGHSVEAERG